jgi:hypothetical protein
MFINKIKTLFVRNSILYVILYFRLRNFVISQFGIRNIVLVILKKIKTRSNAFFITNKTLI